MSEPNLGAGEGRRQFLALIGLAGLSSALRASGAWGQGTAPPTPPATPATPATPAAPATPPVPPEIAEDARALAAILQRRHGQHLAEGDLKEITEELEFRLQGGKRMRAVKLANADEPDSTFHA